MNDITACTNEKCKLKNTCHRYLVEWDSYQSVSEFYYDEEENECEYYWKTTRKYRRSNENKKE